MQAITVNIQIFPIYGLINFYTAEHSPFPSFCHPNIHLIKGAPIGETPIKIWCRPEL